MEVIVSKVRTEKKISLRQLAQISGVKRSHLSDIENNRTSPTLDELDALAVALNVRIVDLFVEQRGLKEE